MPDLQGRRVVFFSHKWCTRDVAVVRKVVGALNRRGIVANSLIVEPVIPAHSIRGTETARIDDADCFAVLWTPEASRSIGVNREITRARETGRDVVLLRWFDTPLPTWYDPDKAYIKIDSTLALPCGPDTVPTFPGLIDRILGFRDIGTAIATQLIHYLDAIGGRTDRAAPTASVAESPVAPAAHNRTFKRYAAETELFKGAKIVKAAHHAEFHRRLAKGTKVVGMVREASGLPFDFYIMEQRDYVEFCEDRGGSDIYSRPDRVALEVAKTIPKDGTWYFVFDAYGKQVDRRLRIELIAQTPAAG